VPVLEASGDLRFVRRLTTSLNPSEVCIDGDVTVVCFVVRLLMDWRNAAPPSSGWNPPALSVVSVHFTCTLHKPQRPPHGSKFFLSWPASSKPLPRPYVGRPVGNAARMCRKPLRHPIASSARPTSVTHILSSPTSTGASSRWTPSVVLDPRQTTICAFPTKMTPLRPAILLSMIRGKI
jgi:hypothetical protein